MTPGHLSLRHGSVGTTAPAHQDCQVVRFDDDDAISHLLSDALHCQMVGCFHGIDDRVRCLDTAVWPVAAADHNAESQ